MPRDRFYRLAEWKRNDMKKKLDLYWWTDGSALVSTWLCALTASLHTSCDRFHFLAIARGGVGSSFSPAAISPLLERHRGAGELGSYTLTAISHRYGMKVGSGVGVLLRSSLPTIHLWWIMLLEKKKFWTFFFFISRLLDHSFIFQSSHGNTTEIDLLPSSLPTIHLWWAILLGGKSVLNLVFNRLLPGHHGWVFFKRLIGAWLKSICFIHHFQQSTCDGYFTWGKKKFNIC